MDIVETARAAAAGVASLGKDALRVHIALAVFLVAAIVLRRPIGDWRPLAAVALASVAGPLWGLIDGFMHNGAPRWSADWPAVATMMFWPAVLFGLARFTKVMKR